MSSSLSSSSRSGTSSGSSGSGNTADSLGGDGRRERVAICITGQLRGFPLAMVNWRGGSLLNILRAGGLEIDWFVVTPNSTSFDVWRPFVESLSPVRVVLLNPEMYFDGEKGGMASGVRVDEEGRVHFNMAKFPRIRMSDNPSRMVTVVVQQFQMAKCRDAIIAHEEATNQRYKRVARLRPDILFSGLAHSWAHKYLVPTEPGFPAPDAATSVTHDDTARSAVPEYLACRFGNSTSDVFTSHRAATRCETALTLARARLVRDCGDYLFRLEAVGQSWLVGSDLWLYGSRDVVMDHYLRTLQILEERGDRLRERGASSSNTIQHLRDVWLATWASLPAGHQPRNAGACSVATAQVDIVRTAGPPTRRFFLQLSETGPDFKATCRNMASFEECVRTQEAVWALPFAEAGRCVGLDYDLVAGWNSSCEFRELEDDLHRAHMRSFGLGLVGDNEGYAKHRMSTALVERYREVTAHPGTRARDGF